MQINVMLNLETNISGDLAMKSKKTFREMSIRIQARNIMVVILVMFAAVCGVISASIRQLVYQNADEHMQVASQRLYDHISLNYDKLENFCINISENEEIRAFMKSSYAQMIDTIDGATECLTRHKILEPMIEDISLVNDDIHYSNVFGVNELDEVIGYCLKPLDYVQVIRFLRRAVQNLQKDRHMIDWADLMEILERREESEIKECLSQLGFYQEKYFVAVSGGERKLLALEEAGISVRLGRGQWQWGYIMRTNRIRQLGDPGQYRTNN